MACTACAPERTAGAARTLRQRPERRRRAYSGLARAREFAGEKICRDLIVLPLAFYIALLNLLQVSEIPSCTLFFLFEFLASELLFITRKRELKYAPDVITL